LNTARHDADAFASARSEQGTEGEKENEGSQPEEIVSPSSSSLTSLPPVKSAELTWSMADQLLDSPTSASYRVVFLDL
jgi:hypothetical protein